jgi:hypothetical protein
MDKHSLSYLHSLHYRKENLKTLQIQFNKVKDKDILDYLANQPNKTEIIRIAVRAWMKQERDAEEE